MNIEFYNPNILQINERINKLFFNLQKIKDKILSHVQYHVMDQSNGPFYNEPLLHELSMNTLKSGNS